ncbi:MAG: TIGR03756 family integrating conjugative element protein [Gammaproteobacteria bacterium]|nr:TIGR03756 family integrating conjugative element protein [Gammaproteobacteria bacterium]
MLTTLKKLLLGLSFAAYINTPAWADDNNDTIDSVTVVNNTLQGLSQCLQYKVVGTCFWLRCTPFGCSTETTVKADHYLPDVVVSAYTEHDNNPWWFGQLIADPLFYQAGKAQLSQMTSFNLSGGDEQNNSAQDINNKFHEVDIIGNPALSIMDSGSSSMLLNSTATPYVPYYSSLLDAYLWRFPALEKFYPGSLVPGLHDVGTILLHDWGSVYPRNGYVNQPDDAKAGAVAALRASTIITELGQPHVYSPLSNTCGEDCISYPVTENSSDAQSDDG